MQRQEQKFFLNLKEQISLLSKFKATVVYPARRINSIYFDLNKSDIRKDASIELDKIVEVLTNNPEIKIELGSHTDSRGSDTYNLKLSDRRAKSSAKYITSKGIAKDRITGIGYGETKLRNQCSNGVKCSKEEHAQNRRTEFKITEIEVKLTPH